MPPPNPTPWPSILLLPAADRVESYGQALLGGPWSLVDSTGKPVTSADFHGKYLLLYFGFTFCPDICPNELMKVARVVETLGEASSPVSPRGHPRQ